MIPYLGTFVGYSSLRMAAQTSNDALIVSIDSDPESAKIARSIHEHAGVANRIQIVIDESQKVIPRLRELFNIDSFDLIFIDHEGDAYLPDLKLLEEKGLIKSGTMIVADNAITPGAPDYLKYIRNSPNYTSQLYESKLQYSNTVPDGVEVSVRL